MINKRRKRAILLLLGFVLLASAGSKVLLSMAARRTTKAYEDATLVLESEMPDLDEIFPHDGCLNRSSLTEVGGGSADGSGGQYATRFDMKCDESEPPVYAGQVVIVVRHWFNPTIEIFHSDTKGGREVSDRVAKALQVNHNVKTVSSTLARNVRVGFPKSRFSKGFLKFERTWSSPILVACAIGIVVVLFWSWLENRKREPGVYCSNCDYDLRGTPGDRCSECGTPIAGRVDRLT